MGQQETGAVQAPVLFFSSPISVMVPVMMPRPVADPARAVIGVDDPAAVAWIVVIGRRGVEAAMEVMPVEVRPVGMAIAAIVKPAGAAIAVAAMECGPGAKATVVDRQTAAPEPAAMKAAATEAPTAVEAAAAVETSTAASAAAAMTTVTDFSHRSAGCLFRCGRSTWACQ